MNACKRSLVFKLLSSATIVVPNFMANAKADGTCPVNTVCVSNSDNKVQTQYWFFPGSGGAVIQGTNAGTNGENAQHHGDSGGNGTNGQNISVANSGQLTVPYPGLFTSAILGLSGGGNGGAGGNSDWDDGTGLGGTGGAGGNITIGNSGSLATSAIKTPGILAYSLGGTGGDGGNGNSVWHPNGAAGGMGGNGGAVDVQSSGPITTSSVRAPGIRGRSEGGAAGNGGQSDSCTVCWFGKGGAGGNAGNSGSLVTFGNSGAITTTGHASMGVILESIGGNGGAGGKVTNGVYSLGGSGGFGGDAGTITGWNTAPIGTSGNHSTGMAALSIGGGGGDGGEAIDKSVFAGVALGGSAGGGGDGGSIALRQGGQITTSGVHASGLMASSIGGGGGHGGVAEGVTLGAGGSFQAAIGGSGGGGGNGNVISIWNFANAIIQTGYNIEPVIAIGRQALPGDYSAGILAQSIGGGGGDGGNSVALSSAAGIGASLAVSVSMGGSASKGGGDGDAVNVDNAGTILTGGRMADGINASSIGGGGGTGGHSISGAVSGSELGGSIAVGIGGSGGDGGQAGNVAVVNSGMIVTNSDHANGILAQSVGGGGGSGGSVTDVASSAGLKSLSIGVGIGGSGGNGGNGNQVALWTDAGSAIVTSGHQSNGILAQSIGGGGGEGGSVHTFAVAQATGASGKTGSASVGVGGRGGEGGTGGAVNLQLDGTLLTTGDQSIGVLAQSIGGGGGHGGNVLAVSMAASLDLTASSAGGGKNLSTAVSVGGSGGNGQTGGNVWLTNTGASSIQTAGNQSTAILAQSIGGGGGVGGTAHSFAVSTNVPTSPTEAVTLVQQKMGSLVPFYTSATNFVTGAKARPSSLTSTLSVGGSGGTGAAAGNVQITHNSTGAISTAGAQSYGIHAQSVGGGGGVGGEAISDGLVGIDSYGLNFSLGGSGGTGGNGAAVAVNFGGGSGQIQTSGTHAHGLVMQSIGGGGGAGGASEADFMTLAPLSKKSFELTIGGTGGASGNGGVVGAAGAPTIATTANGASAIFAQSVGGGGGAGAVSASDAKLSFHLGGQGGGAGDGGAVNLYVQSSELSTTGMGAPVIMAQSVGGGGGHAGAVANEAGVLSENLNLHLGGDGGGGGNGGAVTLSLGEQLKSTGTVSPGIIAQSVGGGGGVVAIGKTAAVQGFPLVISSSGSVGNGGAVTIGDSVQNQLSITTTGTGAHGIVAESIGGGGGLILVSGDTTLANLNVQHQISQLPNVANLYGSMLPGLAFINLSGAVTTTGDNAYGILAISRPNSVAILDVNGVSLQEDTAFLKSFLLNAPSQTSGANIVLAPGSSLSTSGSGADAIRAYTANMSNAASMTIGGTITVSGNNAWAINLNNGTPDTTNQNAGVTVNLSVGNTANIYATGTSAGGIKITDGTNGATNLNIQGNLLAAGKQAILIDQAPSSNTVLNIAPNASVFGSIGYASQWGAAPNTSKLINSGAIHGAVSGAWAYQMQPGGVHYLSITPAGTGSDSITVSSIQFNGAPTHAAIVPVLTGIPQTQSQSVRWTLVTESNPGSYAQGLQKLGQFLTDTLSAHYTYSYVQSANVGYTLLDKVEVNFTKAGLSGNYANIASMVQNNLGDFERNSTTNRLLATAANATTLAGLQNALSALDPSAHFATSQVTASAASMNMSSMFSCGNYSSNYSLIAQANCDWLKVANISSRLHNGDQTERSNFVSFGHQQRIDRTLFAGLAGGYEDTSYRSVASNSQSKGYRAHVGGILKYQDGPWFGAAGLGFSYGSADASRHVADTTAVSNQKASSLLTRLSGGYLYRVGSIDIMPRMEVDMALVHDYGYMETGAGALDMRLHPETTSMVDLHPVLRVGGTFKQGGHDIQAYAEVGERYAHGDPNMTVAMPESGNSGNTMTLTSKRADRAHTASVGVNVNMGANMELRLECVGEFGDQYRRNSGSVKFGYRF